MVEKAERVIHRIDNKYGISSDGERNLLLMEYYEKQEGKGLNAPKTGEWGWRPANGGTYYSSLESLAYGLMQRNVIEAIGIGGLDFDKFRDYIDNKLVEYKSFLKEQVTLELAKTKDLSKKEEA